MKKTALICAGIFFYASAAFGQADVIGLYADANYTEYCYDDVTVGTVSVYAVHKFTPGATACQFLLVYGGGFNCTYVSETSPLPTVIGSAFSGITIAYGACLSSDILLLTVSFYCNATSPACAYIEVVPDPAVPTGTIEILDCDFVKQVGVGGRIIFDSTHTCCIWPTEKSTWGQVKALY